MKLQRGRSIVVVVFFATLIVSGVWLTSYSDNAQLAEESGTVLEGCSVLTCSIGNTTLFGYNLDGHDYLTPFISFGDHLTFSDNTTITFGEQIAFTGRMLPTGPRDGYASFKLDGLCCAGNSLAVVPMYVDPLKTNYTPQVDGPGVFAECDTVQEVIAFFNEYNYVRGDPPEWWWQYHYADALGDSVVVAVDEEGRVGFTEMNETHYTVSTNHNLLDFTNYDGTLYESVQRYNLACDMLDDVTSEGDLTVEAIRDVLEALSADSTTHSLIMNPRTLDMYVYYPENYSRTMCFNLEDELATLGVNETKLYNITELYENWSPTTTTTSSMTTSIATTSQPTTITTSDTTMSISTTSEPTTSTTDQVTNDNSFEPMVLVLLGGGGLFAIVAIVLVLKKRV